MAEHFRGRNHTVHAGNGMTIELARAWLLLAEGRGGAAMDELRAILRARLAEGAAGCVALLGTIDPPAPELADPHRLRAFAELVTAFAVALTTDEVDPRLTTLKWDRELRLEWIARMHQLYGIIDAALGAYGEELPPFRVPLPAAERDACELFRLLAVKRETQRRAAGRLDPAVYAPLAAEIDRLARACPWLTSHAITLTSQRFERMSYWLDRGDIEQAGAAYRDYMAAESDAEMRENARMIWTLETDAPPPGERPRGPAGA